ncbi:MAG: tRNA (adenosine(37)-N6)-dimethylallyltransferase MiaA [Oscillospiraceae bacterium]
MEEQEKIPIVALMGATASGKTSLGVSLACKFNGEIISSDSMQIYKGMDIASAKPTEDEKKGIPHYLMDFLERDNIYSVADYVRDALKVAKDIKSRQKLPFIVGGTGLYMTSLLDNITFSDGKNDYAYRESLYKMAEEQGNEEIYKLLLNVDEEYGKSLHPNNIKRVIRALEVYKVSGVTMTEQLELSKKNPTPFKAVKLGLGFKDRDKLYERIDQRVNQMMDMGLLDEAEKILTEDSGKTSMQAIGIKEFKPYFLGELPLEACVTKLKQATRNYAKRQITWFNRDKEIFWLYADSKSSDELFNEACTVIAREMKI